MIEPIGNTDPIIDELVKDICHKNYDKFNIKYLKFGSNNSVGVIPYKLPERNQPCWCMSGKKYKQCCLKLV